MKCQYKHCIHGGEVDEKDAVKIKNRYYHEDCYKEMNDIKEVIDLFYQRINPNVVMSQLRKTVNTIVYNKKIPADFLLYGVRYYLSHKIPLNYPGGLYYVIQNKDVSSGYYNQKTKTIKTQIETTEDNNNFNYKPRRTKGFGDILC